MMPDYDRPVPCATCLYRAACIRDRCEWRLGCDGRIAERRALIMQLWRKVKEANHD
jgi:hypothetical protein